VTSAQKESRAKEIAHDLCDHSKWLSHGRSIKISDLKSIGLEITDYTNNPELADAIGRYHVLLQMTFDNTGIYKLYETPTSQIQRFFAQMPLAVPGMQPPQVPGRWAAAHGRKAAASTDGSRCGLHLPKMQDELPASGRL
jgi:hypothetical protein